MSERSLKSPGNDDHQENGLSANELKTKLYQMIKNKGILDSMKSQLRNKLVMELHTNAPRQLPIADISNTKQRPNLALTTINSLIINHLKSYEYDYTLSVFLPECGINMNEAYSLNDIFQILKISTDSKLFNELMSSNVLKTKGLLWFLVNYFCSHYVTNNVSVQTDASDGNRAFSTLDHKLRSLEKHYTDKSYELNIAGNLSMEERIMAHQRRIEDQCRNDYEQRMKEFKEIELQKLKVQYNEKFRAEVASLKDELEKQYKNRYESLSTKEKNIDEAIKQKYDIEQRELFMQRQHMLDELKMLRERENDFKRQHELQAKSFENDLTKFKKYEDDFKKREFQLKLSEENYEQRLRNDKEKIKLDLETAYKQREFLLQSIETKNREESKRIEIEKAHLDRVKNEYQAQQIKINELDLELQKVRTEALTLLNENNLLKEKLAQCVNYDIIKEENNFLKAQLETIKIHLGESYLQKNYNMRPSSSAKTNGGKSAFKPVQRKRSVTFASQKEGDLNEDSNLNMYQNESIILSDLNGGGSMSTKEDEFYEIGDRLLHAADAQMLLEQKIEHQNQANMDLKDICEMQLYESRQLQNEVSNMKLQMKFMQNGINLDEDDEPTVASIKSLGTLKSEMPKVTNVPSDSLAFIEKAKQRLMFLENEADNIEKNYRDYQYNLKTVNYSPDDNNYLTMNSKLLKMRLDETLPIESDSKINEILQEAKKPIVSRDSNRLHQELNALEIENAKLNDNKKFKISFNINNDNINNSNNNRPKTNSNQQIMKEIENELHDYQKFSRNNASLKDFLKQNDNIKQSDTESKHRYQDLNQESDNNKYGLNKNLYSKQFNGTETPSQIRDYSNTDNSIEKMTSLNEHHKQLYNQKSNEQVTLDNTIKSGETDQVETDYNERKQADSPPKFNINFGKQNNISDYLKTFESPRKDSDEDESLDNKNYAPKPKTQIIYEKSSDSSESSERSVNNKKPFVEHDKGSESDNEADW